MKTYTVVLHWHVDDGMHQSHTEDKEFQVQAASVQDAYDQGDALMNHHGAFDYDVVEG